MEEHLEFGPGHTIIEQGISGHGFYILESGTLEVYRDEMLLSVLMYPGTIFGEMGDILGKPRTCTVKSKNTSRIIHIPGGDMLTLLRDNPEVGLKIIQTLASRLDRTTPKLVDATRESSIWAIQ